MSLKQLMEKINPALEREIFMVLLIVLVAFLSFALGRLSKIEENRVPILIKDQSTKMGTPSSSGTSDTSLNGTVIASRTGKTYYFPWCGGVKRIKESNKIWFKDSTEAELAGYEKSGNCPGL